MDREEGLDEVARPLRLTASLDCDVMRRDVRHLVAMERDRAPLACTMRSDPAGLAVTLPSPKGGE